MKCCAMCFGDRGLQRSIFPLRSTDVGQCAYCAATDAVILEETQLDEYFELVASAYVADANGKTLLEWLRLDWGLFSHPNMDDTKAIALLSAILRDSEVALRALAPIAVTPADRSIEWQKLRDELMYRNRYFPAVDIDLP